MMDREEFRRYIDPDRTKGNMTLHKMMESVWELEAKV